MTNSDKSSVTERGLIGEHILASSERPRIVISRERVEDGDIFSVRSFTPYDDHGVTALYNEVAGIQDASVTDVARGLRMAGYHNRRVETAAKRRRIHSSLGGAALDARQLISVMRGASGTATSGAFVHAYSRRGAVDASNDKLRHLKRTAFLELALSLGFNIDEIGAMRIRKNNGRHPDQKHHPTKLIEAYIDYLHQVYGGQRLSDLQSDFFERTFRGFAQQCDDSDNIVYLPSNEMARHYDPKTTRLTHANDLDIEEKQRVTFYTKQPPHRAVAHLAWQRSDDNKRSLLVRPRPTYSTIDRTVYHPSTSIALAQFALRDSAEPIIQKRLRQLIDIKHSGYHELPRYTSGLTGLILLSQQDSPTMHEYMTHCETIMTEETE